MDKFIIIIVHISFCGEKMKGLHPLHTPPRSPRRPLPTFPTLTFTYDVLLYDVLLSIGLYTNFYFYLLLVELDELRIALRAAEDRAERAEDALEVKSMELELIESLLLDQAAEQDLLDSENNRLKAELELLSTTLTTTPAANAEAELTEAKAAQAAARLKLQKEAKADAAFAAALRTAKAAEPSAPPTTLPALAPAPPSSSSSASNEVPAAVRSAYELDGRLVLSGIARNRGLDIPPAIKKDAGKIRDLLDVADAELAALVGGRRACIAPYLRESVPKLERLCATRGLAEHAASLPPPPLEVATASHKFVHLVCLLVKEYEAKMIAEFADAAAGSKYIDRPASPPTSCPNVKCGAPILLCFELEDKDFRKQFFSPQFQCKVCTKKWYPEQTLIDLGRQRGLRMPTAGGAAGTGEWMGTPLVRLDRALAKQYGGLDVAEVRKLAFMRGLDLTGRSGLSSIIEILVEEDLLVVAERVWSLQVKQAAERCIPFVRKRGEGTNRYPTGI